ncbi:MAG: alpha/beta hydrolase [Burkholderiales bacterium]
MPTTVVRGEDSHPAMRRIAELLHDGIPASRLVTIAGGSHFLPSSHPAEIAALVKRQVDGMTAT